jgi:hypothetical protein
MNYFTIKIGKTYDEVQSFGFLWAPEPTYINDKGKKITQAGWKPLPKIKKGDVAFLIKDGVIKQLGIAKKDAYKSERPKNRSFDEWKEKGYKVEVELIELTEQIDFKSFIEEFYISFGDQCSPKLITSEIKFGETYSNCLSVEAGQFILNKLSDVDKNIFTEVSLAKLRDIFPYRAGFSWEVISENTATKLADKTLINDHETGIPREIIAFFLDYGLCNGESKTIDISLDGTITPIEINKKKDGRYKLKLKPLANKLKLSKLTVSEDTLWLERDVITPGLFYIHTKCKNKNNSVKPKPRKKPGKTSSSGTSDKRIGQDYFRSEVIDVCDGKCVVSSIKEQTPSILIASHIKSWKVSNDEERMDGHNGLLLSPHIDKLFDKHLITFDDSGYITLSSKISLFILKVWGIDISKAYTLTKNQREYMEYHRAEFKRKELS